MPVFTASQLESMGTTIFTAAYATELAIAKARNCMVSAVTTIRCNHVGRLGEYTEMAAQQGMVAFMAGRIFSGGIYSGGTVAPFGGAARV